MKYNYKLRTKRNRYNSSRKSIIQSRRKYQMGGSAVPVAPGELLTDVEQTDIDKLIKEKSPEDIPTLLESYTTNKIFPFIRTYKAKKLTEMGFTSDYFIRKNDTVTGRFLYIQGFRDVFPKTFQGLLNEGYNKSVFSAAGVNIDDLRGLSVQELKTLQFTAEDFKNAKNIKYNVPSLREAGFTAKELMLAGFDLFDIITGGFDAQALQGAGITAQKLKDASITAQALQGAGIKAQYLKGAGITAQILKDAEFKLSDIFERLGYTYGDIYDLYKAQEQQTDIDKQIEMNRLKAILNRCPKTGFFHHDRNCTYTTSSTGGKYRNKRSRRIIRK